MNIQDLRWVTSVQEMIELEIDASTSVQQPSGFNPQYLLIPIHASSASMQFIELSLGDADHGYRAQIVVEWSGDHLLVIPVKSFQTFGNPNAINDYSQLRFVCRDSGPLTADLTIGTPYWKDQSPLIAINEQEQLLDIFTGPGFWDDSLWHLTDGQGELEKGWLYARLSTTSGANRPGFVSYTKRYDIDIEAHQALLIGLSTDEHACFSMHIVVDGVRYAAVNRKPGSGYEELRVELAGKVLNEITLELSAHSSWQVGEQARTLISLLYWLILEKNGADPKLANEVYGSDDIAPPRAAARTEEILPIGFLMDRARLFELRSKIAQGEAAYTQMYQEIVAEAEDNLVLRSETYLGTYMPINWARQGIERASSPNDETHRLYSTLVYSSFAYAIGGDMRFGLAARRALLTVARIDNWAAGFVARYPIGLRGYRATFVESQTSQAVALCYDFIYPLLSDSERREVEDALYSKGMLWLDAFLRQNGEGYLLKSNQGAVYTLGLLYAAHVAKRSHPDAALVAERWSKWFERMIAGYYKGDGSTNEGMIYWEYTTHYAIEALMIIGGQSGRAVRELIPSSMAQTMHYFAHIRSLAYPSLRFLPLGDCRNEDFKFMGPSLLFFARYLDDEQALTIWRDHYAIQHPPGSTFFGAPAGTGQYTSNGLLTLLLLEDKRAAVPALSHHQLFAETERLFWRTGSEYGDKLLFFEGGPQTFEHTHYDKGQFILEAYGETLAADPGTIDYSKPFSTLVKGSKFHNIVTVNGKDQSYKDADKAVVIQSLVEAETYDFLHVDLSNAYKELARYDRRILFVRPDYWLILDDVVSLEGGLEWNFHSHGSFEQLAGDRASNDGHADLFHYIAQASRGGLRMTVVSDELLTPVLASYIDDGSLLSHHLSLETARDVKQLKLAAVLVPYAGQYADAEQQVGVQVERDTEGATFTVTGSFGVDRITWRYGDMHISVARDGGEATIKV